MAFTLDQVRGFVAVAEEGNFGRAAERLMMTQPPLSRQIQKLERAVGVALFERTSRATILTPAGRAFLAEARQLLAQAEAAPLMARRVSDGSSGSVRLGVTLLAALNVLGRWVRLAQQELPGVDVVLTEMVTSSQVEALLAGEIDIGLLRGRPRPEVLESTLVHTEDLVVAAPAGHPLAEEDAVTLEQVAAHPLVTYAPARARYFYELVVSTFQGAGLTPRYVQYVSQASTILALVDAGIGLALVPRSMTSLNLDRVRYLSIAGQVNAEVELYAAWRRDNDNPARRAMLEVVLA